MSKEAHPGCGCDECKGARAAMMKEWDVKGYRPTITEIIAEMRKRADKMIRHENRRERALLYEYAKKLENAR